MLSHDYAAVSQLEADLPHSAVAIAASHSQPLPSYRPTIITAPRPHSTDQQSLTPRRAAARAQTDAELTPALSPTSLASRPPLLTSPLSAPASTYWQLETMLASSPIAYFSRRHSSPSSSLRALDGTLSGRGVLGDQYGRTVFFCLLFIFLFFAIFTLEYAYIDRTYHRDEQARLELQSNSLAVTLGQLDTKANELQAAQDELLDREQRVQDLHQQLSQRDEALLMYRQLVTDLQERSTLTESDQSARLMQAQLQAELFNKTSFLFGQAQATVETETVTRVTEGGKEAGSVKSDGTSGAAGSDAEAVATVLVDGDNNKYILSSPSDSSLKSVDSRLILDLGIVIISAAIGGLLSSFLHQPPLLGYLLAGSAIGPGGLRLIGQFVQVETLAEFGATFLLFALGVEFSFAKLSRVRNVAVGSGTLMMALMVGVVAAIGYAAVGVAWGKGLFVGAVLSMSSTTVVVKSLMERKELTSRVGQVMLGLLIVQDIFLSLLLSIISLASSPADQLARDIGLHILKFALLAVIVVCCAFLWPLALRMLDYSRSHDLFLLGLVALCVTLTVVAERIIGSAEVGAFLAGILVSSSPTASPELTKRSLRLFEPIRDMFGALFFSSMGMLINPAFLLHNLAEVIALVVVTVVLKCLIGCLCTRLWGQSSQDALHISLCLAQIGEFAFVLASQGLRAGLLVRDDYMLLLGVTAVSIFCTPGLIAGSFWLRRAMAADADGDKSDGGVSAVVVRGENGVERDVLRKDAGWVSELELADSEARARRHKLKHSEAEFLFAPRTGTAPTLSASFSSSSISAYAGQQQRATEEDGEWGDGADAGGRRVLTPTYPLKRGHSSVSMVAAESKEEVELDSQRGGGWKERRRQRQMDRARQQAEEEKKEKEADVRIKMDHRVDERKDHRGED